MSFPFCRDFKRTRVSDKPSIPGNFKSLPTTFLLATVRSGFLLLLAALIGNAFVPAEAQSFTTAVGVGSAPTALAVNPATNKIYVANSNGDSVSVISGLTDTVTSTVTVGTTPSAIAINAITNTIYVANSGSANVTVINGATDTVVTTVGVGTTPSAIAVDPVTNTVYVANSGSNNVSVINGSNAVVATPTVGTNPVALAVNPATNVIYVANKGSANVTVISGSSNQVTTTVSAGTSPVSVAVNPATNQIYVANNGSNNVTNISGATNSPSTVTDPNAVGPTAVAMNAVTNTIYVANQGSNNVTAIAGATNSTTTITDPNAVAPAAVAVNPSTNQIYVANKNSGNVTVIAGATNVTATVNDPNANLPDAIAVNPVTNQAYAMNSAGNAVSIFNGATNGTATVTDASANHPAAVGVNPVTNVIYVANSNSNNVSVILGVNNTVQTVTDSNASHPVALALNPFTNKIYVANANSHNVTVINGANNSATTVTDPNANGPIAVAVNPVTNKIYVANATSNNVTVIDGATNQTSTISDPNASNPIAVAVDPATGKVYVANSGSSNVSVFDPLDSTVQTIADPNANHPVAMAINAITNEIFVANSASNNVTVISGTTNTILTTIGADESPSAIDLNPVTDTIYVTNSGTDNVTVINGSTLTVTTTVAAGTAPHAIVVNATTNQIYVANNGNGGNDPGSITAIDGPSNATMTFADPNAIAPYALAVNTVTNEIYVANNQSANVTAVTERSLQVNGIQSTITPLSGNPNNQTGSETPTINFAVTNNLSTGPIDGGLFQIDSWTGAWTAAAALTGPGAFTATTASLLPGFHIIYVFGTDGEEGTSTITGMQSSPLIGNIAAYGFLVAPPVADISPATLTFSSQQTGTQSPAQTVTLGNTGGSTLTFSHAFTGANASDFTESSGDTCSIAGGQLAPNASCAISVIFTPSTTSAETAALTFTDNSNGTADSVQNVALTGIGSAVPTYTLSIAQAGTGSGTVSSTPSGISCQPTCSASFNQDTIVTLSAAPSAGSTFVGWSAPCTGTGSCVVTLSASETVTATFNLSSATACPVGAATIWTGGASGNWSNSSNWSTGVVPNGSTVNVCINDGHSPASAVTLDISVTVANLIIDSGNSLTVSDNTALDVTGKIQNAGLISVAGGANNTFLNIDAAVMLTGGGSVTMSNGNSYIRENGTGTLTNVNNTISGIGTIGNDNLTFINQAGGTVNATGNALVVNAAGVVNHGVFEATGSGVLQISVTVNNAGGTITAGSGSQVQFLGGTVIQGGLLSTASGATFLGSFSGEVVLDGSSQGTLTNTAAYTVADNTATDWMGTINNTGSFLANATANDTFLNMDGAVTLIGAGAVTMTNGNAYIRENPANSSLTNVNNTILGSGTIGNNGLTFINQAAGIVNANSTGNALLINANGVVNQGLFEATNGGLLQINVTVNNLKAKIISSGPSSAVQFQSGAHIEAGTLNDLQGAVIGSVSGTVILDGTTEGVLTNAGSYTINDNTATEFMGTINNTGSFAVNAGANDTFLNMDNPVTLTGGGSVTMTNGNAYIRQDGTASLTNVNNIISGSGTIGNDGLTFINQSGGIVNANLSAAILLVNANNVANEGLFEGTGGGILQVNVTVNNAGGTISAASGSQVQLTSADIQGGLLTSTSGATFFGTSGGTVVLDGKTQGLLTNAAAYTISNNTATNFMGTINNTASFAVNAGANDTFLNMTGAVTLTGSGTVTMTNGNAYIRQSGGGILTNVNNLISGVGTIGNDGLTFINQAAGVVNATGNAILINANGVVNRGLFEATGGGVLQISVPINNAGANITAASNSTVNLLGGARIEAGTMSSASGATFQGTQSLVILDGSTQGILTNAAAYVVADNAETDLVGTINNTGSIAVNATSNDTFLSMEGSVTLTGAGNVTITNGNAYIRQNGAATLTNVNNTISGAGTIGNDGLTFINQAGGIVNSNISAGTLLINANGATNQGLFEATGSGILQVSVTLDNQGGTITAANASQVQFLNGADLQGGLLTSASGATFFGSTQSTVILDGITNGVLTNAAVFAVADNTSAELMGTINNTGSINVNGAANNTFLYVANAVTLTGSGILTLANGNTYFRELNSGSLTNSGNSITGPGNFQVPTFTQTAGFFQIPSGISDALTTFAVSGGNAQVDGTLSASTGGVATSGSGFISGTGSISSPVTDSGITEGGDIPAAGILAISSSYIQSSSGSYEVAIGGLTAGTQYSQLHVTGAASVAGALNVRFINGFTPAPGNQFTILTAASVTGNFSTINSPSLPAGFAWSTTNTGTSILLTVVTSGSGSFTLTISEPGSGSGSVTDDLGQINCVDASGVVSGTCSASYLSGTVVTLTATPSASTTFNGWSTCTGTGPCSVTVNNNQTETATFGPVVPGVTLTVSELGTGTGNITDNMGLINCSESQGVVTGTCSANYTGGTVVTLTENATSPTTFGGWGGACASSGTGTSCAVTMNSALTATANFVPPPVSQTLTFPVGTNTPAQQATFDCPSNIHPCTDPSAHALALQVPQVNDVLTLTVTATEVPTSQANGLCESGNTVLNDFDCRFVTFFNYGTQGNDIIVPLCYPYANGNCVHYDVYSGTPGSEPNPSFYSGGVSWTITFNNDTFLPPAPYTGSQPRFYDDPDYAPTPTSAVGTLCTQPMTINGVPQNYSCQFEFDITTFFNATETVDSGIGGHTKQFNDVVVAFPPSTAGQLVLNSTANAASVNAGSSIGFTITVSNSGPGIEDSVTLNDPLPSGSGVNWSISPAYSGPGMCSITGSVGNQTLGCSFGNLASAGSASVSISSASAGTGTYTNAASLSSTNSQLLTVATENVLSLASVFSNLTPSQSINAGTSSIALSGTISAPGPAYPPSGETVSVTINNSTQNATIGTNGAFLLNFPVATIPASATPYTITYNYPGDSDFASASNSASALTVNAVTSSPTLTITPMGTGTGSVTDNLGLINCSESQGVITGSCSASYTAGTTVTLIENASSPTTFGGWGGACAASGTGSTCAVTMNSALTATANFVPPPVSQNLTFPTGTNTPPQQAVFNCPSNTNPCTDPNAHSLALQVPQVNDVITITVTATEVPPSRADGLCEVGNTVLNDFDCRFVTFFNFGTDANGNTIVPLCYPYANGNCVHYDVYSGTPGSEPNPSFYNGGVSWTIAWNNDTYVPPAPWTGSQPRLYDDPDYAPTPTSAVGTLCTQPMTINGVSQSYSCQFEFDITTFFNATEPVDSGIGGHTKQFNDVVVAFPPSTAGQLSVSSTPDSSSVSAGSAIGFTVTVNNAGPGIEDNVMLNDPLPSGTAVNWSISPAYSGPGTCSITGSAGSQVLGCSLGNLSVSTTATVHVTSATAPAGIYVNAATITTTNSQFLTITTITVQALASAFSSLTPSQTIVAGTSSIPLSGTISAPGPSYPLSGETVSVTINSTTQNTSIGSNGAFSLAFPTPTIPASATAYTITYSYPGDNDFAAVTNATTTLTVDQAPKITSMTSATYTVGNLGSFTVTATGIPTPTLSESGALPMGVMFTASTGILAGTPAAGTAGSYPITFNAGNGVGSNFVQNFTLTVSQANQAPMITSPAATTFTVGTTGTFTVTATGSPKPTLSESGTLPMGVMFNTSTGVLSGMPAAGTGGTYAITFTAGNGVGSNATQSFTLTVDQAPAITSAANTAFTVGVAGSFTVTATGFPKPTLSETGALPSGVTFRPSTGVLGGTPAANTMGTYPITFTATNALGSNAVQNFTLTISSGSNLKISPTTVNFGKVYLGTIAVADVTLTNTGGATLDLNNVNIVGMQGGDPGDFFYLSLCPRTLSAGKSCIIGLSFVAIGKFQATQNANLVITDTAAGSPQSVPLLLTEINPRASLSSNELNFGTQKTGTTSKPKTITLTNNGNTALTLGTLTTSGNFRITSGTTCANGATINASASCVINVTFTPKFKGSQYGTLKITDNALIGTQEVSLLGTGN
jgi:YVTN family beta-propeller protein